MSKKTRTGYLARKCYSNKVYIYLRKSFRENGKTKNKTLYSFGVTEKALDQLKGIRSNPDLFPLELKRLNFNLDDVDEWILTLETKVTSTGREFNC